MQLEPNGISLSSATTAYGPGQSTPGDHHDHPRHRPHRIECSITIIGSGRLGPTITALLGLAATVLGVRAVARARRPGDRDSFATPDHRPTALLLGMFAVLLGGLFLATADGGPGTGNGVVGSAAAMVFGFVAIGLDRFAAMQRSPG